MNSLTIWPSSDHGIVPTQSFGDSNVGKLEIKNINDLKESLK